MCRAEVENPLGTRIYGRHAFSALRISPEGSASRGRGTDHRVLDVLVARPADAGWGDLTSLAWPPSATRSVHGKLLPAVKRTDDLVPGRLDGWRGTCHFSDVVTARESTTLQRRTHPDVDSYARMGCSCLHSGIDVPRDGSWLDGSAPEALSRDGETLLLSEALRGGGVSGAIYLQKWTLRMPCAWRGLSRGLL